MHVQRALDVSISGRGVVVDKLLHELAERHVRSALMTFAPHVRGVHVTFACPPGDEPMCTIRAVLRTSVGVIVRHHAASSEIALREALRMLTREVACQVA